MIFIFDQEFANFTKIAQGFYMNEDIICVMRICNLFSPGPRNSLVDKLKILCLKRYIEDIFKEGDAKNITLFHPSIDFEGFASIRRFCLMKI